MVTKMPSSIRVRRMSAVLTAPDAAAYDPLPLSPFDALWVPLPPPLNLYFFKLIPPATPPFPALVESLAEALASFHPFAGELTYHAASNSVFIETSAAAGVAFVEAETELDFRGLVEAEELDEEALRQLVPDIAREALPAPAMGVQVTEFLDGGGLALGLALHHAVAGFTSWTRGGSRSAATTVPDRSLVRFDGDKEFGAAILRQMAPNLPRLVAAPKQQDSAATDEHKRPAAVPVTRQTFTISAAAVKRLKRQLAVANGGAAPSTFAAVTAHTWVSFSRAGGFDANEPIVMGFVADIRAHMSPPVDRAYTGNCLAFCVVSLRASELDEYGLDRAAAAIRSAVERVKASPLEDKEQWVPRFAAFKPGRSLVVSGSPWFPSFDMDLGFGTPVRAERAGLPRDGQAYITAGKEPGSVLVMLSLAAEKMPAFREAFLIDGVGVFSGA
ncbi:hypothetical protein EJB05_22636, partial [Eragrostis curvula]